MSRSDRRLLPFICAIAALAPAASASAADAGVTHAEAVEALQAAQGALSTQLSSGAGPATREATPALRDLAVALPALRGAERRQGRALLARPTDQGRDYFGREAAASPICNANFCIHWTDKKENAPGTPDFINQVIGSTDLTYAVENGALAWQGAKSDGTRGTRNGVGDQGQVDVYITNLPKKVYGYASPDRGQKGSRRFAYLVLDNTYTGFPSPPLESLAVSVAHEYNHILQFNYDTYQDLWMFESTATWAEQQVYPDIDDYLNYLPSFAAKNRMPLTTKEFQIYSEAVWNHWLSVRFGPDVVRDAWAASEAGVKPPHYAIAAYTASIKAHGGESFSTELGAFAAATAEWSSSLNFPDAAIYPDVKRQGAIGTKVVKAPIDDTSFRLLSVKPTSAASVSLKVQAPRGIQSSIALVGREGAINAGTVTTALKQLRKGGTSTVTLQDPGRFARITAVIANTDGGVRGQRDYVGDGSVYKYSLTK